MKTIDERAAAVLAQLPADVLVVIESAWPAMHWIKSDLYLLDSNDLMEAHGIDVEHNPSMSFPPFDLKQAYLAYALEGVEEESKAAWQRYAECVLEHGGIW